MTRSTEANRRYWSLLHVMAEKIHPNDATFSVNAWHEWSKSKFLGAEDLKLPSGRVLVIPRSTADLDTAEFNDFMTAVEAFANEHGAYLEDAVYG